MSASTDIPGRLVQAVFKRVLAQDVNSDLAAQLAAEGLDLAAPLQDSYARDVWYRAIDLTAAAMMPAGNETERQRRLGRHIIDVLQSRQLVKGPWLSMAKLLGPRRALLRAAELGGDHSPVGVEVNDTGGKSLEITVDEDRQSEFLAGLLEGAVETLGGKDARVAVRSSSAGRSVFSATWR